MKTQNNQHICRAGALLPPKRTVKYYVLSVILHDKLILFVFKIKRNTNRRERRE